MRTVPTTDFHRRLVLAAYAATILSDFLTDCAVWGTGVESEDGQAVLTQLPAKLEDHPAGGEALNEIGIVFEETFLQFHAPQWALSAEGGLDFRLAAIAEADRMLTTLHREG